jgi:hypothetical protein
MITRLFVCTIGEEIEKEKLTFFSLQRKKRILASNHMYFLPHPTWLLVCRAGPQNKTFPKVYS